MEKVRKISKRYYVRQIVACWLVWWMAFGLPMQVAMAAVVDNRLPTGENVTNGSVGDFDITGPGQLHIRDIANQTIIQWDTFDIGADALTEFHQGGVDHAVLNRVMTADASDILGQLTANGRVFLINPAGIIFGENASVNVAQLVASSLDILDADFIDGMPYAFTGGATAGNVENNGPTSINAERIYLIGKQVINRGALVAEDYVIMAAGETVTISEDSPVSVVVTMPDQTPGEYDYIVDHGGENGTGEGSLVADHVILAAGDIWSTAISGVETLRAEAKGNVVFTGDVSASAEAASDAVADVTIITGGNFTVEDYTIEAVAVGNGVDNAYATVTIDAAGDVSISGDLIFGTDSVKAEASDGVDNEANVNITGRNVTVVGEWEIGPDSAAVKAEAHDGVNNTAGVTIIADGVDGHGNVVVESTGLWNDDALISAKAQDGTNNTATVDIDANGDVEVAAEGEAATIEALAKNDIELPDEDVLTVEGLTNTATVDIDANGEVVVVAEAASSAIRAVAKNEIDIHYEEQNPFVVENLVNNATVDISGTNVEVSGEVAFLGLVKATVEAIAENEIKIKGHEDEEFDVTIQNLDNTAQVLIVADGEGEEEGNVVVEGGYTEGEDPTNPGNAQVLATARNVLKIGKWSRRGPGHEAFTLNLTTDDLVNTALVDIDATDNIIVTADGIGFFDKSDAIVRAEAYNELEFGWCVDDVEVYLTAGLLPEPPMGLMNDADVLLTATNGNVEVTALHGGRAKVEAKAYNKIEGDYAIVPAFGGGGDHNNGVYVEADNLANDALVDIDAGDDVLVTASSEAEVLALAWNDIPGELSNEAENITNNANINIDATNVDVKSEESGEAHVIANAYDGTDNTAGVTINALGNVEVMHNDDAEASIKAVATSPWGDNSTAAVDIDAYANLLIDNGFVGAWAESGLDATATVTVDVANVHVNNGEIRADADTYFGGEEGDALATVGITTTGPDGVVVENSSEIVSDALAINSGDATASTTVTASNVTVNEGSGSEIGAYAEAYGSGDATATTEVTTTSSEVIVDNDSDIWSYAYSDDESGDATATTTVTADYVTVDNSSGIYADAYAYNDSGDATATVDVTTTSSEVIVDEHSDIVSYAYADDSGDATAETTVEADYVSVDDFSYIYADAEAYDSEGDATATVDVTTTASEVDVDDNSYIYSYAYSDDAGDATAETTVEADDITVEDSSYIYAEADAYGNESDATATTEITTTSSEVIVDDSSYIYSYAYTDEYEEDDDDSGDATARTTVIADDVTVDDSSEIYADAEAYNGESDATATTEITTTSSEVIVEDNSYIYSYAYTVDAGDATALTTVEADDITVDNSSYIYANAEAYGNEGDATATTEITTTGSEVVVVDSSYIYSYAETDENEEEDYDSGDATARTTVIADDVTVDDYSYIYAEAYAYENESDATATTEITGTGSEVIVEDSSYIYSYAYTEYDAGDATAETTVDTGDVSVIYGSEIYADAESYSGSGDASATLDIDATGDVLVDGDECETSYVWSYAYVNEAAEGSGDATAETTVDAANVTAIDSAEIYAAAEARNGSGDATATVDVTLTGSEVFLEDEGRIYSDADTRYDSGDAVATTTIIAGDVTVVDSSDIYAEAEARYGSGDATATTDITMTGSDILVEDESYIGAYADTGHGSGDAEALVAVADADNVTVSDDSEIEAEADADYGSGDATALVDIDADGDVLVEDDSKIVAWAATYKYGSGDATATVDIDAGGNVIVSGDEAPIEESGGGDSSKIMAHAMTKDPKYGDSKGSATADVDIDAGGYLLASRDAKIGAVALVLSGEQGMSIGGIEPLVSDPGVTLLARDATATVDIVAAGDVTVEKGSEVIAKAYIENIGVGQNTPAALEEEENGDEIIVPIPGDATAGIVIDSGGDVTVNKGSDVYAEAEIYNEADVFFDVFVDVVNGDDGPPKLGDATASVEIVAPGDVTVEQGGRVEADASIDTYIYFHEQDLFAQLDIFEFPELQDLGDATANVDILSGGDVTVSKGGKVHAEADLYNYASFDEFGGVGEIGSLENGGLELPGLGDATAGILIDADGELTVDKGGEVKAEASIGYYGDMPGPFPPKPVLFASGPPEDKNTGDATASIIVDAFDGVTVGERSEIVADAWIHSYAFGEGPLLQIPEFDTPTGDASASVDIQTCGDVIVNGLVGAYADIYTEYVGGEGIDFSPYGPEPVYSGDTSATVDIRAYGDVIVNSEEVDSGDLEAQGGGSGGGQIEAWASNGEENSAAITILAVGDVIVNDGSDQGHPGPLLDSKEEIRAAANNGSTNDAFVGIATREGFGGDVIVDGQIGARTWIGEGSMEHTNTSSVEICADQDVIVTGGYAKYGSIRAEEGRERDPVLLEAEEGGQITAAAQGRGLSHEGEPASFNTTNVEIFAGRDVTVEGAEIEYVGPVLPDGEFIEGYYDGGQIIALSGGPSRRRFNNDSENTAYIGISAQRDVAIHDATITGQPFDIDFPDTDPFDVDLPSGEIIAGAHGDRSINDTLIEICAQDDVIVDGEIRATSGTGIDGVEHQAHIVIAAGNIDGFDGGITGSGHIEADADDNADEHSESITFQVTDMIHYNFAGTLMPEEPEFDIGPVTCPACDFDWVTWDWCEDCEELPDIGPAPISTFALPLDEPVEFGPGGCPLLMAWLADELGVGVDIQVVVANAYAYSTDCQPCDAAARLQEAARILADEDGAHMAAMLAVFNELAPAGAPFTPEMGTTIATAFSGAAEGSQYATVAEYVDAFVQYIAILDTELGSPLDDSVAFVMGRYGTGLTESANSNLASFIATRMEAGETFAP